MNPKALTEEQKQAVRDVISIYDIPATDVCVNGIRVNGYIQYSEMEAILEVLK